MRRSRAHRARPSRPRALRPLHSRWLPSTTLIVIAIALETSDPTVVAFQRAAQGVLGPEAAVRIEATETDPPDDEVDARGADANGIVELTLSEDRARARLHCYVSKEKRWVDREIVFGSGDAESEREASERGRLLGFAAATLFTGEGGSPVSEAPRPLPEARPLPKPLPASPEASRVAPTARRSLSFEFAGTASAGIGGTAAGLGAAAGLRFDVARPLFIRGFLAGRAGSIPEAQSTTRTLEVGAGLGVEVLPEASRWLLGVRADGMVSYFQAAHLSEDDPAPDRQSRFLPGADLLAEAGFRITDALSLYAGAGVAAMFGTTSVYTHGEQVAVVPAFRMVGELGLRTGF